METFFTELEPYDGLLLHQNIYSNVTIESPATILDCMHLCMNVQSTVCEFFLYENETCYLGSAGVSDTPIKPLNVTTIYAKLSKYLYPTYNTKIKNIHQVAILALKMNEKKMKTFFLSVGSYFLFVSYSPADGSSLL